MDDEFLNDEFFMKLIRLGVQAPELRHASRQILHHLHTERRAEDADEERTAKLQTKVDEDWE